MLPPDKLPSVIYSSASVDSELLSSGDGVLWSYSFCIAVSIFVQSFNVVHNLEGNHLIYIAAVYFLLDGTKLCYVVVFGGIRAGAGE